MCWKAGWVQSAHSKFNKQACLASSMMVSFGCPHHLPMPLINPAMAVCFHIARWVLCTLAGPAPHADATGKSHHAAAGSLQSRAGIRKCQRLHARSPDGSPPKPHPPHFPSSAPLAILAATPSRSLGTWGAPSSTPPLCPLASSQTGAQGQAAWGQLAVAGDVVTPMPPAQPPAGSSGSGMGHMRARWGTPRLASLSLPREMTDPSLGHQGRQVSTCPAYAMSLLLLIIIIAACSFAERTLAARLCAMHSSEQLPRSALKRLLRLKRASTI